MKTTVMITVQRIILRIVVAGIALLIAISSSVPSASAQIEPGAVADFLADFSQKRLDAAGALIATAVTCDNLKPAAAQALDALKSVDVYKLLINPTDEGHSQQLAALETQFSTVFAAFVQKREALCADSASDQEETPPVNSDIPDYQVLLSGSSGVDGSFLVSGLQVLLMELDPSLRIDVIEAMPTVMQNEIQRSLASLDALGIDLDQDIPFEIVEITPIIPFDLELEQFLLDPELVEIPAQLPFPRLEDGFVPELITPEIVLDEHLKLHWSVEPPIYFSPNVCMRQDVLLAPQLLFPLNTTHFDLNFPDTSLALPAGENANKIEIRKFPVYVDAAGSRAP